MSFCGLSVQLVAPMLYDEADSQTECRDANACISVVSTLSWVAGRASRTDNTVLSS
jgi:hypothetical protein